MGAEGEQKTSRGRNLEERRYVRVNLKIRLLNSCKI